MEGDPDRRLTGDDHRPADRPGAPSTGPRVGLVLGGGGVVGYAFHVGVLAGLVRALGWDARSADIIVGTSSGSIVAALLRGGLTPSDVLTRVLATGPDAEADGPLGALVGAGSFETPDLRGGPTSLPLAMSELRQGLRLRPGTVLAALLPEGRVSTRPLRDVVEPLHPGGWPPEELWITATEQQTGRLHVFGRDPAVVADVATAVEASCAIPGYFAPIAIDDHLYVDGGVNGADNADLLVGRGLDLVVVTSPLSIDRYDLLRSPMVSALRAYPRRQLRANVAALEASGTPVLAFEPDGLLSEVMGLNAMAPDRLRTVVRATGVYLARRLHATTGAEQELLDLLI